MVHNSFIAYLYNGLPVVVVLLQPRFRLPSSRFARAWAAGLLAGVVPPVTLAASAQFRSAPLLAGVAPPDTLAASAQLRSAPLLAVVTLPICGSALSCLAINSCHTAMA